MKKISLFMLMAVGLLISGNLRADNVCKIGDQEYATLTDAIAAVPTDVETTITMIENDVDETPLASDVHVIYTIPKDKMIILDLNNHKISRVNTQKSTTYAFSLFYNYGNLTITDNSSEKNGLILVTTAGGCQYGVAVCPITNKGKLIVNGGHIFCNANTNDGGGAYFAIDVLDANAELVINGGVIEHTICAAIRTYPAKSIIMNGGEVRGINGIWCQTTPGSITINNGTFVCSKFIVQIDADAQLTINDGVFNGYFDLYEPTITSVKGGIFNSHNGIRMLDGIFQENFIEGGVFYFSTDKVRRNAIDNYVQFVTDNDGKPICKSYDTFTKWGGDLGTIAGWEALGYEVVDETENMPEGDPKRNNGPWYRIYVWTEPTEDYNGFLQMIAEGYAAVDITGTSEGRTDGQEWPDKTVIVKKVETKEISQSGELPEAKPNDAVVIKGGADVTISGEKEVEVYSLNVESGSLTVGADATVIVGAGGVTENSVITVEANENGMGVFKIDPNYQMTVDEENDDRPTISVDLYTKARTVGGVSYWQFFARPTGVTPTAFYPTVETSSLATIHNIYGWDAEKKEYVPIMNKEGLSESFTGYAISNNSPEGGVVYHFEGKLNENENGKLPMTNSGFNLVGNSYIAPVALKEMLASIAGTEGLGDKVELSIWYYDSDNGSFKAVTSLRSKDVQLQPLQGFFMYNMSSGAINNAQIDYLNAVWNNNASAGPLPAPAHGDVAQMTMAQIIVSANGNADIVEVFEDAQFSADFDNGADASKLMNPSGMFNLYSSDNLASVATDNLDGVQLTFKANDASTYTMSFNEVAGDSFMILDKETGIYTTISNSETYTFQAQPNTTYADRFCLVAGHKAPTNATKVEANKSTKGIYSIMGQYFGTNRNALPAGVYIENGQKIVK